VSLERRLTRRQLPAIPPAVERYRRERDRYIKLADRIAEI